MKLMDQIRDVRHAEKDIFDTIRASGDPVVLWGAGEIAWCVWTYLRQNGIDPVCFCDNDPAKQGTKHLGLPVYGYDGLKERFAREGRRYHIVVATGIQYRAPIFAQLAAAGERNPIWYIKGFEVCGEKIDYPYVREHAEQFEEAYASLADDVSRNVFVHVLIAKLSGDFDLYRRIMSPCEYFDEDVIRLAEDEVYLDVGAYRGRAIIEFARRTRGTYDGIIAFEPDKRTLDMLRRTVEEHGIRKVELHNKGAWDRHAFLSFHDGREGGSRILEPSAVEIPANSIEVDAIDNVLDGRRATYISMDIEGAEHNAILGAERTIRTWRPKMAVSVYHKREDLFDLLLLIKSFDPQYRFHMRHYTENQTETVLYAV